jgi:serine/threonine protein kinase
MPFCEEVLPDQGDMSFNPILCDVWALGIILFIVLTGVPPVDAALETDDRFRMIAEGRLREMVLDWGFDLSREVLDLIQNILRPEPDQRLTLSRILSHPWMMLG